MAGIDSDSTFCSELERENLSQIRRSKRLSQKLTPNIRSNENPLERLKEIHRMLKSDRSLTGWSKHDWLALQFEVVSIKSTYTGKRKFGIKFIEQTIKTYLEATTLANNSSAPPGLCVHENERVKSPNVLAGMTTEVLTQLLPPYQPMEFVHTNEMAQMPKTSIPKTQANPLDLTKKHVAMAALTPITGEPNGDQTELHSKETENLDRTSTLVDSMIDLTDEQSPPKPIPVPEPKRVNSEKQTYTSKWLKYLPTQQQPKCINENKKSPPTIKDRIKPFKNCPTHFCKDKAPHNIKKPTVLKRAPRKSDENVLPSRPDPKTRIDKTKAPLATSMTYERDFQRLDISPPESSISPDFIADFMRVVDDDLSDILPASLKSSFKNILGTDSFSSALNCEKIVYSLTEGHVRRLASALNVQQDALKRTIEHILTTEKDELTEDDMESVSSVRECSQSPTQRLFPSQRSQPSK